LVKTFWGWRDQQLPDGTVILTSPSGQTNVTTPDSALLFPSLCLPTADLLVSKAGPAGDYGAAPAPGTAPIASPSNADKIVSLALPAAPTG
jgi:hypothetical protein